MKTIIITIVVWEFLKWAYHYFLKDTVDEEVKRIKDEMATGGELPPDDDEIRPPKSE